MAAFGVTAEGLAGVGLDSVEGGIAALDAHEGQVLNDGFRRLHALEIEILVHGAMLMMPLEGP
jgi:hypothetical protein